VKRLTRVLTCVAATASSVALFAIPAEAHVTIDTLGTVAKGSFAKLAFSVPNERDDAGTVSVKVQMPQNSPLASVSVQPKPGWEVATTTRTLTTPVEVEGASVTEVVDTITWTATGDTQIKSGEFEDFWISAGEMPSDVDSLAFPTIQTYSDGQQVAWIEPQAAGQPEPEHPVPTLQLIGSTTNAADDDSITLAVVALIVAAVGLIGGITAVVLARKRAGT